ncbi:MAG: NADH-quinone oxidoreductase subunit NuoH [Elusimicrobia bacterium]|nr:NADH-quinone oxidoreductase subunit NuoH [Elusimicrobiota bacterium]
MTEATPTPPAPKPSPAPAAAKPAPAPKIAMPTPVLNHSAGKLLTTTRYWPTELWANPWASPNYRRGALMLAAIIGGVLLTGAAVGELSRWGDKIYALIGAFVASQGWPQNTAEGAWILLKALIVLHVILINGLWAIWWERKISAHIQSRVGPTYSGGFHGWAQTIFDGIKLLLKEDITPDAADKWVHALAPGIVVAPVVVAFAPVSFGTQLSAANIDIGVLYVFAFAGISVIGIVMAGWASGNKYSLLGGLRAAAQIVSYELPRAFSVVPVLMLAGSLNLEAIALAQAGYWHGLVPRWFLFYPVVGQIAFLIFLIASVAETNRTPFDIPEAESELVSGFHTEYSGMKWSIFFLAEYGYVLLASFLLATFFLGGGAPPLAQLGFIPSWIWMLAKALLMMFIFLWTRWTFPRLRADQLMDFNWKFLLPWSFANIALAGAYLLL